MSDAKNPDIIGLEPFSFQGWDEPRAITNPPLDFADKRRRECDRLLTLLFHSNREVAEKFMVEGRWWFDLPYLSKAAGGQLEAEQHGIASHSLDALLARASTSSGALFHLAALTSQLLGGMCVLAAHDSKAAEWLVHNLNEAVAKMNTLALHKPSQFTAVEHLFGVPGILSPFPDQQAQNEKILKLLSVGKRFPIPPPEVGKKGKKKSLVQTPSNRCAIWLYDYIRHARTIGIAANLAGAVTLPDQWTTRASQLEPLSSKTWPDWFEIAWKIVLEVTNNQPENEPILYEIGKSGANKKLSAFSKTEHPETRVRFVRDRIRYRIREAFKSLVGECPLGTEP